MQPPETEPTTRPSSRIARVAPFGRGLEPQVLMTVTSSQRRPARSQAAQVLSTSRSMLSISVRPCFLENMAPKERLSVHYRQRSARPAAPCVKIGRTHFSSKVSCKGRPMRILLVEDDEILADALYRARWCSRPMRSTWPPTASRPTARCHIQTYDLVVLDVGLPGISGFEILRRLRRRKSRVPVLAADRARRAGGPGARARPRRRRLPDQALRPARTRSPRARAAAARAWRLHAGTASWPAAARHHRPPPLPRRPAGRAVGARAGRCSSCC